MAKITVHAHPKVSDSYLEIDGERVAGIDGVRATHNITDGLVHLEFIGTEEAVEFVWHEEDPE